MSSVLLLYYRSDEHVLLADQKRDYRRSSNVGLGLLSLLAWLADSSHTATVNQARIRPDKSVKSTENETETGR